MKPATSFIKRYPQGTFWAIAWASSFFTFFMNARDPEGPWMFFLYGTFLSGILVTAIADGRSGLKTFFSRIVRWRVGIQWYAVALFLPLALRLAAFGLNILSGAAAPTHISIPAWSDLLMGFFWPSLLGIALAEEPAIRGFALPRLMNGRSALTASLFLGVLHTIWHIPLFITGEDSPVIILVIFSGAILNTWLFNKSNGSVLMCMLLHASVDLWVDIFNPLFTPAEAMRQTLWLVAAYVVVAILLAVLSGKELGREREVEMQPGQVKPVAVR